MANIKSENKTSIIPKVPLKYASKVAFDKKNLPSDIIDESDYNDSYYNNDLCSKEASRNKNQRALVWLITHGLYQVATCYCGESISTHTFESGHIDPVSKKGIDHYNNRRAICRECNNLMKDQHMENYYREKGLPYVVASAERINWAKHLIYTISQSDKKDAFVAMFTGIKAPLMQKFVRIRALGGFSYLQIYDYVVAHGGVDGNWYPLLDPWVLALESKKNAKC